MNKYINIKEKTDHNLKLPINPELEMEKKEKKKMRVLLGDKWKQPSIFIVENILSP